MRLYPLVIAITLAVSGSSVARECFIDSSTGIRACTVDPDPAPSRNDRIERGPREPSRQDSPQEAPPPPALVEIGRDRVTETALLRRLAVRAESLPVGPAAMPTRILAVPAGEAYLGAASVPPAVKLRVPTGYTPPSSIPLENLRRAAAIVRAIPAQPSASCKNPYDPCNEDTRFLGQQAGKALEGRPDEPLQVVVPDARVSDVAARRRETDSWVAQAVAAGKRLDEMQTRRAAIERRLAPLKREYDAGNAPRGAEQGVLENEYRGLVEQERQTQGELGQAQKRVAEILVEVVQ